MTIVSYSTVPDNNQALAPEGTMPVNAVNDAIRLDAANVRGFANTLAWYDYGSGNGALAAERVSGTQFRVSADLRSVYEVGRRVRATGSATGDIQGVITGRTFASPFTTVTVMWDSGSLSAEAITVYVSTVTPGTVSSFAGRPLVLSDDFGTRLRDEGDRIGVHVEGKKTVEISEDRVNILGTNDDANVNPRLALIRRKPSAQEAFDGLGAVDFFGRDSSGGPDVLYARMWARPATLTPGAADGVLDWAVSVAGTLTRLMRLRPSVLLIGKTFADSGVADGVEIHADGRLFAKNTTVQDLTVRDVVARDVSATSAALPIDANRTGYASGDVTIAAFRVDGTPRASLIWNGAKTRLELSGQTLAVMEELAPIAITGSAVSTSHTLVARPKHIDWKLRNVTTEHGYAAGDDARPTWQTQQDSNEGATVWANATTVGLAFQDLRVVPKAGGNPALITPANWQIVFVVSA